MSVERRRVRAGQEGFALILALLTLVLLTTLGLTLATTTSSEVQIAANYRYGRQALYNAEAGLAIARYELARIAAISGADGAATVLPPDRGIPWTEYNAPPPPGTLVGRDYFPHVPLPASGPGCDFRGGVGYGKVLDVPAGTRFESVQSWAGQAFMGGFTIFVKRPLVSATDGTFHDQQDNWLVTVTVVGTAPQAETDVTASTRQLLAQRVLQQTLQLRGGKACRGDGVFQTGRDQLGTNFDPCSTLTDITVVG